MISDVTCVLWEGEREDRKGGLERERKGEREGEMEGRREKGRD